MLPTFAQLLEKDSSVSIHIRNLQVLVTEIFKARNNLSPSIVKNIFKTTNQLTAYVEKLFSEAAKYKPNDKVWNL